MEGQADARTGQAQAPAGNAHGPRFIRPGLLRQHGAALEAILRILDLAAFALGVAAATGTIPLPAGGPLSFEIVTVIAVLMAGAVLPMFGLYRPWRGRSTREELQTVALAWGVTFLALGLVAELTGTRPLFPPSWALLWAGITLAILLGLRIALRTALAVLRRQGFNQRHIVLVGAGPQGRRVARHLAESPWTGYQVRGFFQGHGHRERASVDGLPMLGPVEALESFLSDHQIDEVWVTTPLDKPEETRAILFALRHSTASIRYVPDVFGLPTAAQHAAQVAGMPVVNLAVSPLQGFNRVLKTLEDYLLASLFLLLASPLMLAIAIGVKLSSPGPVFYRQERVSWNGRRFQMLKFRSMPRDAEQGTGPVWAKPGEQRATRFGAFLRRTSLDELPQFLNVLLGDMSIVGPRPERPVFIERFKEEVPGYMQKHLVKAGITGWAQVHGWRGDTCLHTRLEHDIYYIEHWSLGLDIKIIALTLRRGLVHRNAY